MLRAHHLFAVLPHLARWQILKMVGKIHIKMFPLEETEATFAIDNRKRLRLRD